MSKDTSFSSQRNKVLLFGGYALFVFAIYSFIAPFLDGTLNIQDPLMRARHLVSIFPALFIASLLIVSQKTSRPSSLGRKISLQQRVIKSIVMLSILTYFVTIPLTFIGVHTGITSNNYNLSAQRDTLMQRKQDIMSSLSGLTQPSAFIAALEQYPSITNVSIKPGTSPTTIRKSIESVLDQAIVTQLKDLKSQQDIQMQLLIRNAIAISLGCALAGISFLVLKTVAFGSKVSFLSSVYSPQQTLSRKLPTKQNAPTSDSTSRRSKSLRDGPFKKLRRLFNVL